MNNSKFYNILSSNYDSMIDFKNSLDNKVKSFKNFIEPDYKTVLDLGCGTGVDSIALSQLGLTVDAVDHSEEMIIHAIKNAVVHSVNINFSVCDLSDFKFEKNYDIIVSLGNTLSNINFEKVEKIILSASKNLNSHGKIIIQIINYSAIPKRNDFILNTFENEVVKIVRKYNFENDDINFVIEIENKSKKETQQIITKMFHHSDENFKKLSEQNLLNINFYGSFSKEPFDNDSKDLVIFLTN